MILKDITTLTQQESTIKRDLADKLLLASGQSDKLIELMKLYREGVKVGQEAINAEPKTKRAEAARFEARHKIISGLVKRVEILPDGTPKVDIVLDLYDNCTFYNKEVAKIRDLW